VIGIGMFLGNWLLGDPYRDYAATRKRLVPYVW
jgi:hypothetical protein